MNRINKYIPLLILAISATITQGQSFPIVPLTQPTYPAVDPIFPDFIDINFQYPIIRSGDINQDGLDDIVTIPSFYDLGALIDFDSVWIFLQKPTGGFDQPYPLSTTIDSKHSELTIVDFTIQDHNHDGVHDLVFMSNSPTTVIPLINSNNEFELAQSITSTNISEFSNVIYQDINLDLINDLILTDTNNLTMEIWIGHQTTGYTKSAIPQLDIPSDSQNNADIRFSDFDADQDLDILITNGYELYWMDNTPTGYLSPVAWNFETTNFDINIDTAQVHFAFADVNADGSMDAVIQGYDDDNEPAYGFFLAPFNSQEPRTIPTLTFPDFESATSKKFVEPNQIWNQTLFSPGDLDGDGTHDLILKPFPNDDTAWRITDPMNLNGRFGVNNEMVIHGDGGLFENAITTHDNPKRGAGEFIDVNNDGVKDRIYVIGALNHIITPMDFQGLYRNGIMLTAVLGNTIEPGTVFNEQDSVYSNEFRHITHADLDYDGEPEALLTKPGSIRFMRRDNDDLWDTIRSGQRSVLIDGNVDFFTITTQLDTDPRLEVMSLELASNTVMPAIFMNVELEPFGEHYRHPSLNSQVDFFERINDAGIEFFAESSSFASVDVDNDGDNDILIRGQTKQPVELEGDSILVWYNDGNADFTPGPISSIQKYEGSNVNNITTLDANHDGFLDLISIEREFDHLNPIIGVYINDGQGLFTKSFEVPTPQPSFEILTQYWIETSDIDLDGFEDLIVLNRETGNLSEITVLFNSPTGLSTEPVHFEGRGGIEVHCVDLDQNGLPDLFTCLHQSSTNKKNSISIMFQMSPREFLPTIAIHDLDFAAVDAFDMNRDGIPDLIGSAIETLNLSDTRIFFSLPAPCPADMNLDRKLNFFDISLFLNMFTQERPLADLNRDGTFNFYDISALLQSYQAGCP